LRDSTAPIGDGVTGSSAAVTATVTTRVGAAVRSDFLRQIVGTLGTRAGMIAASLVTSVLVARALGAEGRGIVAVAGAITGLGVQFGNLGLHASNTWAVARKPALLPTLTANAILVSAFVGALEIAIVLVALWLFPGVASLPPPVLAVALVGIPIGLAWLLLQNLLLGLQRIRDYNLFEVGARATGVAATIAIVVAGLSSPIAFLAVGTSLLFIFTVALVLRLRVLADRRLSPSLQVVREFGGFGLKAYSSALISFLVLRLDLLLVEQFQGLTAAGYYSIAVAIADLVYMLPVVVGMLLFPRLSRIESPLKQALLARSVALRTAAIMIPLVIVAGVLASPAIELLYGSEFTPATPALLWLLPGIAALSVHTIVMNYCAALGNPRVILIAPTIGLVVNLALNLVLIPPYGIVGASLSSTIAYSLMLAISAAYLIRRIGVLANGTTERPNGGR
jgi:O-antigen/teichoic acid export membrane protein